MRLWLRFPTLLAVLSVLCNVDFVVMPILSEYGIGVWPLSVIACFAATAELSYWYWYAGWLGRNLTNKGPLRRAVEAFREGGLLGQIRELRWHIVSFLVEHAHHSLNVSDEARQTALDNIRRAGIIMAYPPIFGYGAVPFFWPVGIVVCRASPVPGAFWVLAVGNALKTSFVGLLWLMVPIWLKLVIWAILLLVLVRALRKWVSRRRAVMAG